MDLPIFVRYLPIGIVFIFCRRKTLGVSNGQSKAADTTGVKICVKLSREMAIDSSLLKLFLTSRLLMDHRFQIEKSTYFLT